MKKIINLIAAMTLGAVFAPSVFAQAAALNSLTASATAYVGTVELTWQFAENLPSGATVYIQYDTNAGASWAPANAQVQVPYYSAIGQFETGSKQIAGLRVKFDASNANLNIPYYFHTWVTSDNGTLFSTDANTSAVPLAPSPLSLNTENNTVSQATATVFMTGGNVIYQNDDFQVKNSIARSSITGDVFVINSFAADDNYNNSDIYVRKYDQSGAIQWTDVFNSEVYEFAQDYGRGIVADGGDVYVVGSISANELSQGRDIWLRRYDSDGNIAWTRTFNSGPYSYGDDPHDLAVDGTYVYVTGSVNDDVWIGKYTKATGVFVSSAAFDGQNGYDNGYAIAAGPGGGLWVAGKITDASYNSAIWLGKFDSDLAHVWASTYSVAGRNGFIEDALRAVAVDANSNAYVAGYEYTDSYGSNAWFAKYDPNGNKIFHRSIDGPSSADDKAYGVAIDNLGNAYVTGRISDYNSGQAENILLAKYTPSGVESLKLSMDRQNNSETGFDVTVTSAGFVYVGAGMMYDYGLLYIEELQSGGAPALAAGPGPYTGSVHLSWMINAAGTHDYAVQYSTYSDGMVWSEAGAQIVVPSTDTAAFTLQEHMVQGLRTYVDYEPGMRNGTTMPTYYFKAWVDGVPVNSAPAEAAPTAPYTNWDDYYGGGAQDRFWVINSAFGPLSAIARDAMGNTYLAYGGNIGGKAGLALQRLNQNGETVRISFYNSDSENSEFVPARLFVDDSGVYVAGGIKPDSGVTGYAPWFARFDGNGLVWQNTVGSVGEGDELAYAINVDDSGNVYAAGSVDDGSFVRMFVAKHSPAGTLISSATYIGNGALGAEALALARDASGDVYLGGYSNYVNSPEEDQEAAVVKFDSSLVFISSAEYSNSSAGLFGEDAIEDLAFSTATGALYATGSWYDYSGTNNRNLYLSRVSAASLTEMWRSTYNSVDNLEAAGSRVIVGPDGDLHVAGWEQRSGGGGPHMNMLLKRFSADGTAGWTKSIDGMYTGDSALANNIAACGEGYFCLAGVFNADGTDSGRPAIARVGAPQSGAIAWPGNRAGTIGLSWIADRDLPTGTTFYVRYATYTFTWDSPASTHAFVHDSPVFGGMYVDTQIAGLEAGRGAPGYNDEQSPLYTLRVGYQPAAGAAVDLSVSTSAKANTPGFPDRLDRFPNGNLYSMMSVHGERIPLVRDSMGKIYVGAYSEPWGPGSRVALLRKYSALGMPEWTRFYADRYEFTDISFNGLAVDNDDNIYAVGTVGLATSPTGEDLVLVKYDATGRMQWSRTYDYQGGSDEGYAVEIGGSNIYLAGSVYSGDSGSEDMFVAKLDMDGVVISSAAVDYNGGSDEFYSVKYDPGLAAIFLAGAVDAGLGNTRMALVRTDVSLAPAWTKFIGGGDILSQDALYSIAVDTAASAIYAAGTLFTSTSSTGQDMFVAKYLPDGTTSWTNVYHSAGQNNDRGFGVALDGLGGVYAAGSESRYDLGQGRNALLRKFNTSGDLLWTQTLNSMGGNNDTAYSVAADEQGRVYAGMDAQDPMALPEEWFSNGINGAGFFRHVQLNTNTVNPSITVAVNGSSGSGLQGVPVVILPFNQTGSIDPNGIRIGETGSDGSFSTTTLSGLNYLVALSSANMVPTIKEQISDPMGNFFVELNADTTRQYYLYGRAANEPVYTMNFNLMDGVDPGDVVMAEVYMNQTGEKAGYGIIRATALPVALPVHNLTAADSGVYGMSVTIPAKNKVLQMFMDGNFPAKTLYQVYMSSAMQLTGGFDVAGSTSPPSLVALVTDPFGSPLENALIEISKYDPACTWDCQPIFRKDNQTDVNGRAVFYGIPPTDPMDGNDDYDLHVRKAGYESNGNRFDAFADMPVTMDFQLALATYTLSGVLKYNGAALPNARIMVNSEWNNPQYGTDSYRNCDYGSCGIRAFAQAKTGADGSFTVTGLTDGNARIDASFEGGWRSFNEGLSNETMTDDFRVVISSQGARYSAPNTPNTTVCKAGRAWVLNSSGTCVTAGNIPFNIIPSQSNTAGRVHGYLTFITSYPVSAATPLIISTSSPLTIMAQQECRDNCQDMQLGFASVSGVRLSSTNVVPYEILLSTGYSYWGKVMSTAWARASSIETSIDLSSTDTFRLDMTLTRAGALTGQVKFPDGSNFRPSWGDSNSPTTYNAQIRVEGVNVDYHDGMQTDEYGSFEMPNLAPGIYNVRTKGEGAGFVWAPASMEGVTVTAGKTTDIKLKLENGLAVKPQIFGLPAISTPAWSYFVIAVEAGQEMSQKQVTNLFFSDPKYSFEYSSSTGWSTMWMPQGQYDFYLVLGTMYCPGGCGDQEPESYDQFGNFIGRARGVSIQKSDENPNLGTSAQPIPVSILGSIGTGVMAGRVTGDRIFTESDYDRIFANFDSEIEALIPAVMLYDTAGDLRAFSHSLPTEQGIIGFETGLKAQDPDIVISTLAAHPLEYYIWGLPPGRYTAVFANPNYPPSAMEISLPENESYDFDFDEQDILVGGITGVVRSSATGAALGGARVFLDHRTVEKFTLTDSSGVFSFANLPAGIYRMEVSREGYVTTGVKTGMSGSDSLAFNIYMSTSSSRITGKVYLSKFPTAVTKAGVTIVAYDETRNVESPADYLPKTEIKTSENGSFEIHGVIPGHLYKVSAFYSGKLPESIEVTAEEGNTVMPDITMKDVPPQITIKVKKSADSASKVDVRIKSPKTLISIPTCRYNPGEVFDSTGAVSLTLAPAPGNSYVGQFTLSRSQQYYTIKVEAGDGGNKMEKVFVYDQVSNAKTEQYIQQESLAGGEVQMDKESEEYSGIELDPGAITYTTTTASDFSNLVGGFFSALPSVRTVKTAKGDLSISDAIQNLMASEVYNMDLSNAQPNKPFTLTLKYDKERATNSGALKVYQQDASGNWNEVPGNYTVDPMSGVVSVDVASLDLAYEGTGSVNTPLGRKRYGMSAVRNGRYVPSAASSSQSGRFAVFTAKPGTGVAYTGSAFKVYNMPNPFDLRSKNVVVSADGGAAITPGAYTTAGTLLKYHLPAGKTGAVKFVIYNVAGEKVRTIEEGTRTGGEVFYSEWDGRNDAGRKCASGVYFLMTFLDGEKLSGKAHKMALIK